MRDAELRASEIVAAAERDGDALGERAQRYSERVRRMADREALRRAAAVEEPVVVTPEPEPEMAAEPDARAGAGSGAGDCARGGGRARADACRGRDGARSRDGGRARARADARSGIAVDAVSAEGFAEIAAVQQSSTEQ